MLFLGGFDPSYGTAPFKYYPVILQAWWTLNFTGVSTGSTNFNLDSCFLDTGTSIIEGTPEIVEGLIKAAGLPPIN
jgi:cathepsin D